MKCSYTNFTGYGCIKVILDQKFQAAIFSCLKGNTTEEGYVPWAFCLVWQHWNGNRTYSEKFWSASNQTRNSSTDWGCGCNYTWQPEAEVSKCNYCYNGTSDHNIIGGPLGTKDTLYYHAPVDTEAWDGLFPNGTSALKGHYWICGQYAYSKLPQNWTGICYVSYTRSLFFLLPQVQGNTLGIKVYNDSIREERSIDTSLTRGSIPTWGKK